MWLSRAFAGWRRLLVLSSRGAEGGDFGMVLRWSRGGGVVQDGRRLVFGRRCQGRIIVFVMRVWWWMSGLHGRVMRQQGCVMMMMRLMVGECIVRHKIVGHGKGIMISVGHGAVGFGEKGDVCMTNGGEMGFEFTDEVKVLFFGPLGCEDRTACPGQGCVDFGTNAVFVLQASLGKNFEFGLLYVW